MAEATETCIFAAGAVSGFGLTAQRNAACAAARAQGATGGALVLRDASVLRGGFLDMRVLGPLAAGAAEGLPRPSAHYRRLLRLARPALMQATAACAQPPPVFVAVPHNDDSQVLPNFATRFVADLYLQCSARIDTACSEVVCTGRAGFWRVLERAATYACAHGCFVVAGAVDGFCDLRLLAWLDHEGRLPNGGTQACFSPAEGAAFVLIGPPSLQTSLCKPWARVRGLGFGHEPGHRLSEATNDALGLTHAVADAIDAAALEGAAIDTIYPTLVGDALTAVEWATASLRLGAALSADPQMRHCQATSQDPGVALGALQLVIASWQLQTRMARGPALLWSTDDRSERAACVLEAMPEMALSPDDQAILLEATHPAVAQAWYASHTQAALEQAAGLYSRWRRSLWPINIARTTGTHAEARLLRDMTFLRGDAQATAIGLSGIPRNRAGFSYIVLRLALEAGCWANVEQVLLAIEAKQRPDAVPQTDASGDAAQDSTLSGLNHRYDRAIVDACVHSWAPLLHLKLEHHLTQGARRCGLWAAIAGRLQLASARPSLIALQRDKTLPPRLTTAALAYVAHPHDRPVFMTQMQSDDARSRRQAALGLLRLGERRHVEALGDAAGLGVWLHVLCGGAHAYTALHAAVTARPTGAGVLALGMFGCIKAIDLLLQLTPAQVGPKYIEQALYLLSGVRGSDGAAFNMWLGEVYPTLDAARRYRLGALAQPALLAACAQDLQLIWPLRQLCVLELQIRYNVASVFDAAQWPQAQAAALQHTFQDLADARAMRLGEWC